MRAPTVCMVLVLSISPLISAILCIVTAQGDGRCKTIHTVNIAVHSVEGCRTATTISLTSINQKL